MNGHMVVVPFAALLGFIVHPVPIVATPSTCTSQPSPELAESCDPAQRPHEGVGVGDAGSSLLQTRSKKGNTLSQRDNVNDDDNDEDDDDDNDDGSGDDEKERKGKGRDRTCIKQCRSEKRARKNECPQNNNPGESLCPKTRDGGCSQWRQLAIANFRDNDYGSDRLACQKKCSEAAGCANFGVWGAGKKCYLYRAGCTNPTCEADPKCAAASDFYQMCEEPKKACKKLAHELLQACKIECADDDID